METLGKTTPHFIRCVKPNKQLKGNIFDGSMVLEQLRYAGLLEVCKIRKQGYPVRREHAYVQWRFGLLMGKGEEAAKGRKDVSSMAQCLVKLGLLTEKEYLVGKTKLFLKSEAFDRLEHKRGLAVDGCAVTIQAMVRGKLSRVEIKKARALLRELAETTEQRNVEKTEQLLLNSGLLPNQGRHLKEVKAARKMMQQVYEEQRVEALVIEAIASNEIDSLTAAIHAAKDLKYSSPSVNKAELALEELKRQLKLLELLGIAIASRELTKIQSALKEVSTFVSNSHLIPQAQALIARLSEEEKLISEMTATIKGGKVEEIKKMVDRMVSFGMGSHPLVEQGLQITKEKSAALEKFQNMVQELAEQSANAERDMAKLDAIRQSCLKLGVKPGTNKKIDAALKLLEELEREELVHKMLQAAQKSLKVKAARQVGLTGLEDLQDIKAAIKTGMESLNEEDEELKETQACLTRAEKQINVQQFLQELIDKSFKDLDKLKSGLELCQGLELNTVEVYIKVRERILQLDEQKRNEKAAQAAQAAAQAAADAKLHAAAGQTATPSSPNHRVRSPSHVEQSPAQRGGADLALTEDQIEKKNKEKLKNAISPGFDYGNYFRLRSDADFAKGIMFNKNKPIASKLSYQSDPIHKSLLEAPSDVSRQSVRLNRSILGYCGDVVMSFPASLAQDLVEKCLAQPDLSDEVYMQLCKHATSNPEPQSVGRVWQLFCICVGCFPPSTEFEPYLLNFFLKAFRGGSIVGQYAKYALRRLQSTISFGPTSATVSIDEIVAYGERPPVMASIQLIDGTNITKDFPVPPHMNVDDVLRICSEFLALSEEHSEWFGIFVKEKELKKKIKDNVDSFFAPQKAATQAMPDGLSEDLPPPPPPMDDDEDDIPPRTPYPLESSNHLGDIVLNMARNQCQETFVFKRKFFLPTKAEATTADPIYNRLMYLQVLDEVMEGNWHCPRLEVVVELAAISFIIDLGDECPSTAPDMLAEGLMDYIPAGWKDRKSETEWAKLVLSKREVLVKSDVAELELLFMKYAQDELPTFGSCVFYVRKEWGGSDYIAFVDFRGIRVMTLKTREVVIEVLYKQVKKFVHTSRVLRVEFIDKQLEPVLIFTSQGKEIWALTQDYRNLLNLIPEEDLIIKKKPASKDKRFSTAQHSASPGSRVSSRRTQDLLAPPTNGQTRDRILSVGFMQPGPLSSTQQASRELLAGKKKAF